MARPQNPIMLTTLVRQLPIGSGVMMGVVREESLGLRDTQQAIKGILINYHDLQ